MTRRLNPWAVVITAALTFGSLMAFVGPRSFGHHQNWGGHRGYYNQGDWKGHGNCNGRYTDRDAAKTDSVSVQYASSNIGYFFMINGNPSAGCRFS